MMWERILQNLRLGVEVLVRNGVAYFGLDLGTSEAEVSDSFLIGNESPYSEKGQEIIYRIQEKFGKW